MTSKKKDIKWPEGPVKLSDEDFDAFVKDFPKTVVDCWAEWCGPCKLLGPVIKELAGAHKGEIAFGKLDVDENDKVSDRYGVQGIPTLLVPTDHSDGQALSPAVLDGPVQRCFRAGVVQDQHCQPADAGAVPKRSETIQERSQYRGVRCDDAHVQHERLMGRGGVADLHRGLVSWNLAGVLRS